jgi:aminopeptidase N
MQNLKTFISLIFLSVTINTFSQIILHDLYVKLSIKDKSIEVVDSVTIPKEIIKDMSFITFSLNKNLTPESIDNSIAIKIIPENNTEAIFNKYTIGITHKVKEDLLFPIKYSGTITEEISSGAAEYARGFSETNGIISDSGVYLAGSTYWVPSFDAPLLSFNLTITLKSDWNVVSQGDRIINEISGNNRIVKYQCKNPTEEVYLISAAWTEYEQKAGDVILQAFLRSPDSALASRYLEATSGYLNMYVNLIGQYPYNKFALVENFWETGYGMPSFTLLGEKIIRFPWILSTSYPHELLHNWWGNSVYVDTEKGNWCEGLTAYMADHLLKEQSGQGAEYRRTTLQKFTDYVNAENDFPVIEFRSRNNAAEEAIGYGKCLMFNHMLRKMMGDDNFIKAYQSFYKDNIYKISSFDDIEESLQKFSVNDLKPVFDQWLLRKGAPSLKLSDVYTEKAEDGFNLHFALSQTQEEEIFILDIPVAIYLENKVELITVTSDNRTNSYTFRFPGEPVKIEVDPQFDVFRMLDKAEVPPSLSQIFGSSDGMIILPKSSPLLEEYKALAETWKQIQEEQGKSLQIKLDEELDEIPDNKSAWVIGFENKFAGVFTIQKDYHASFDPAQTELINTLTSEGSLVYAIPNPENNSYTIGFIGSNVKQAVPGLARLLTHYGKYSFLGFEGERPNNVLKGEFPALNSPLFYPIPCDGKYLETNATIEPAKALIE